MFELLLLHAANWIRHVTILKHPPTNARVKASLCGLHTRLRFVHDFPGQTLSTVELSTTGH